METFIFVGLLLPCGGANRPLLLERPHERIGRFHLRALLEPIRMPVEEHRYVLGGDHLTTSLNSCGHLLNTVHCTPTDAAAMWYLELSGATPDASMDGNAMSTLLARR